MITVPGNFMQLVGERPGIGLKGEPRGYVEGDGSFLLALLEAGKPFAGNEEQGVVMEQDQDKGIVQETQQYLQYEQLPMVANPVDLQQNAIGMPLVDRQAVINLLEKAAEYYTNLEVEEIDSEVNTQWLKDKGLEPIAVRHHGMPEQQKVEMNQLNELKQFMVDLPVPEQGDIVQQQQIYQNEIPAQLPPEMFREILNEVPEMPISEQGQIFQVDINTLENVSIPRVSTPEEVVQLIREIQVNIKEMAQNIQPYELNKSLQRLEHMITVVPAKSAPEVIEAIREIKNLLKEHLPVTNLPNAIPAGDGKVKDDVKSLVMPRELPVTGEQKSDTGFRMAETGSWQQPSGANTSGSYSNQQTPQGLTPLMVTQSAPIAVNKVESPVTMEQMGSRLVELVKELFVKQQPAQTTMRLKLYPQNLGEVTVRLTYNRGEINAQFYASTANAKEALEIALPQMRESLMQQQVKLNEATVFFGQDSSQWSGRQYRSGSWNKGGNKYAQGGEELLAKIAAGDNTVTAQSGLNMLI